MDLPESPRYKIASLEVALTLTTSPVSNSTTAEQYAYLKPPAASAAHSILSLSVIIKSELASPQV